jgi:hypothetical protein
MSLHCVRDDSAAMTVWVDAVGLQPGHMLFGYHHRPGRWLTGADVQASSPAAGLAPRGPGGALFNPGIAIAAHDAPRTCRVSS